MMLHDRRNGPASLRRRCLEAIALIQVISGLPLPASAGTASFDPESGLRLRSDDHSWRATLGGRVDIDRAWYNSDVTEFDDDTVFRRIRPSLAVKYGRHWSAFADYDLGNAADGWQDAWVQYRFSDNLELRVGGQKAPFGMANYESSGTSLFMERPLATQLAPGPLKGALLRGSGHSIAWSLGFFGNSLDNSDRRKIDGTSVIGRFAITPLRDRDNLLHVGASLEYRNADSLASARFRARPESYATDRRLIDTRDISGAIDLLNLGVEVAWAPGSFLFESEFVSSTLNRQQGPDADFSGWYATAGYILTGERHRYRRHTGLFGDVDPRRKWGAVELVARYSTLDLTDLDTAPGGEEANTAVGVNWYWKPNCRLMVNYIRADADPNRNGVDESPSLVQARLQVGF